MTDVLDRTDLAHVAPKGAAFDDLGRGEEEGKRNISEVTETAASKSLEVLKQVASTGFVRKRVPQGFTLLQGGGAGATAFATGTEAVLLVAYDGTATGPLASVSHSEGLLGGALVLVRDAMPGQPRLQITLEQASPTDAPAAGALAKFATGNAMLPMLPLFEALAQRKPHATLMAGHGKALGMEITYD